MKTLALILLVLVSSLAVSQTITWSPTVSVNSNGSNLHPRIVLDGSGKPLIIWGNSSAYQVYFSKWNGTNFTSPVTLNSSSIPVFTASWAGPDIASHGDTVYVVFKHTPEDTNHIYLVSSFDGGMNFSKPSRVDFIADSISRFATITTDESGNPLVAFMKFDPGFKKSRYVVARSTDFGKTFSTDMLASGFSGGTVCDCCPAALVSSGNTVAMIYRDNFNNIRDSWAGISTDNGKTFKNGMAVDNAKWNLNYCPATGPDGVIIGDSLYSVFSSNGSCYFSRSSCVNLNASPNELLTGAGRILANYPRIAANGKMVAIAGIHSSGQLGFFFSENISSGLPMTYKMLVNSGAVNADVAIKNGIIHVVWQDDNSGTVKYAKGIYTPSSVSDEVLSQIFSVFPNPVSDEISVNFESENSEPIEYVITDISGKILLKAVANLESQRFTIYVSELPAGIYFLNFSDKNRVLATKFIKTNSP